MKSFVRLVAAMATLLFVAFPIGANEGQLPQADGVIRKLDRASGTVTITHGEIANLNMGAMTMSFKAKTPALLKAWKEGDKIRFRAAEVKGVLTVISIEAAK
ncbi:MAG: copper-binding protein [Sulfuritalea sp.]|nr:copper-binding protein [Sulfuritalea sp.]